MTTKMVTRSRHLSRKSKLKSDGSIPSFDYQSNMHYEWSNLKFDLTLKEIIKKWN